MSLASHRSGAPKIRHGRRQPPGIGTSRTSKPSRRVVLPMLDVVSDGLATTVTWNPAEASVPASRSTRES